ALWERRWHAAAAGWLLFAVATGALVAPYQFRAFRNLLPLVPLACALVALLYARMRAAVTRPRWVDAGMLVLPVVLFASAVADYDRHELSLVDSRERAAAFVGAHLAPGQRILVQRELAFVPTRLAGLGAGAVELAPKEAIGERARSGDFAWILLGEPRAEAEVRAPLRAWLRAHVSRRHHLVARFGRYPTDFAPGNFKGNGQLVLVLRRAGELRKETAAATAGER
ncbi:MAG TPA: hypothetical protein VGV61_19370, partial [Thermoanaerobaculia bacterium]|nr:hypothetical protein [Thermoanaerobaculia bacterium]